MKEELCIIFITILSSLSFNLSCPGPGQWNFRAVFYCSDLNKYTCLLDTSKTRYTETCDGPREETEGHKATINRNNFDTAKCRSDRFQPIDFTTVGNSDCVFQKSKCAQEGQIAAHEIEEKSSLIDTKCLCDYAKGYSFINLPKDKCYCSPLVEDCSCFKEFCPSGKILSPDYQCTTKVDMENSTWNCSNITFADDGQKSNLVEPNIDDEPKNARRSRIAVQVIVPILLFMMVGLTLLIGYWRSSLSDEIATRVTCLEPLFRYGNNSKTSVTGECLSTTETIHVPINDCSSDQSCNTSLNKKDTTGQVDDRIPSDDESYHSTLMYQTEENKSDMKSESYENKNLENDDQYGAFVLQTVTKSLSLEMNTIDQNNDVQSETPEKEDDKNHDEIVKGILNTSAAVNGTSKEHIAYAESIKQQETNKMKSAEPVCTGDSDYEKAHKKNNDENHDEKVEVILTTTAENGTSKESEVNTTFKKKPEDEFSKSVKSMFATGADNETNEESDGLEKSEVEHDENHGESEEAILSSYAENGETSIKLQDTNKIKSAEPVCTGDSDYEKAPDKNNDKNHDEVVEVILTVAAEYGTSTEPEAYETFGREPEDKDGKSVKAIFDTEADNETNKKPEGLEPPEVEHEEKNGESEEANFSSDAENKETSKSENETVSQDNSTDKKMDGVPEKTRTTEIDFETLGDFVDSDKEEENDSDVNNASTNQKAVGTEES